MDFSWLILLRIIHSQRPLQRDPRARDVAKPSKRFLRTLYFWACRLSMFMQRLFMERRFMEALAGAIIPYEHHSPRICLPFSRCLGSQYSNHPDVGARCRVQEC